MKDDIKRPYSLTKKLVRLLEFRGKIGPALSVSMYYISQTLESERSSIFLFQNWNQKLSIFSSLDLIKHEVGIPTTCGVAGWVFINREPALVNNAYADGRFFKGIDEMTNFHTRNLICTPLLDYKDNCIGTLQSINKIGGDFTRDDIELLKLAAHLVAAAISNGDCYTKLLLTNEARRQIIINLTHNFGIHASPTAESKIN